MGKKDPRVDEYIAKAAPFAQPILKHLRAFVHKHCPDCIEELKWSHPHFSYQGMFAGMASFKTHATFGFWHPLMRDKRAEGMGTMGKLQSLKDLPSNAELVAEIKKAMKLSEEKVKPPKTFRKPKPAIIMPPDLETALNKNRLAARTFESFAPSCRREYVEWITEAKRPATREARLLQTMEWLAEGKKRNWKYANC